MEKKIYDVLIVGAGIGGSLCARELSKKNKKVILIEKQPNYPVSKDTLVTRYEYIEQFKFKKSIILNMGNTLTYGTHPEKNYASFTSEQIGIKKPVVIDCNKFINENIKSAINNGCIFKINEEIKNIEKQEDYYIISIKNEDYSFKARIIIDASGTSCSVSKKIGIYKQRYPIGYCNTFLTERDNIKDEKEAFFEIEKFNKWFWIYPITKNKSYVGLYTFKEEKFKDFVCDINFYLKKHGHEYFKHYNTEYGFTYLNQFSPIKNNKIVVDSILFLGESGGTTTPLLGEGFRPICTCVLWLMENIDEIISGKKKLEELNNHFFKTTGKNYLVMRAILPFILQLNHKNTHKIMTKYILKLNPKSLYKFTTLSQTNNDWKDMINNITNILSNYDKIKFVILNPVKTLKLIDILKKHNIIKSVFELI